MAKFRNTYRVESARMPGWDYTYGWYFITICTHRRKRYFGWINDGTMYLSCAGRIVAEEWLRTQEVRPGVQLDAWVVMPDHFHALIGLGRHAEDTQHSSTVWAPESLGAVVCQFKSLCTKRIRREGYSAFAWQTRYHDRIVHTPYALQSIRRYIARNPLQWKF